MAWTTPRTWVTDEVPTAAILNTHIRDNFNTLGPVISGYIDSGGNISYGTGFSASRTATGRYTITFSVTYAASPIVIATVVTSGSGTEILTINTPTAADVQVNINTTAGSGIDTSFIFSITPQH